MAQATDELRIVMAVRRLTARDVSRRSGIHDSRLSRIFNGQERLTPQTERRIIEAIWPEAFGGADDDHPAA